MAKQLSMTTNAIKLRQYRAEAKQSGKCQECRCRAPKPGCTTCEICIANHEARKQRNLDRGRCACGRKRVRGIKVCAACQANGAIQDQRSRARKLAARQCLHPGCHDNAELGRQKCMKHLAENARRSSARRNGFLAMDLCAGCGSEPIVSETLGNACLDRLREYRKRVLEEGTERTNFKHKHVA